jgi:hypothetical protein
MEKSKISHNAIAPELEKYSPWPKRIRMMEGPILIISIIYVLIYIVVSFYLWVIDFQISDIQQNLYLIGFALFLISIYLTFIGFMFRSINKKGANK